MLYHGSSSEFLDELSPKNERIRDRNEGPMVFATPDKAFATMFLGPRPDDSWSAKGNCNGVYYILISDEERYREEDKGGIIYGFPNEGFIQTQNKGMKAEWASAKAVTPTATEKYSSALQAMLESGVQVYFVDATTLGQFKKMQKNPEKTMRMLQGMSSENKKLGINSRSFQGEQRADGS